MMLKAASQSRWERAKQVGAALILAAGLASAAAHANDDKRDKRAHNTTRVVFKPEGQNERPPTCDELLGAASQSQVDLGALSRVWMQGLLPTNPESGAVSERNKRTREISRSLVSDSLHTYLLRILRLEQDAEISLPGEVIGHSTLFSAADSRQLRNWLSRQSVPPSFRAENSAAQLIAFLHQYSPEQRHLQSISPRELASWSREKKQATVQWLRFLEDLLHRYRLAADDIDFVVEKDGRVRIGNPEDLRPHWNAQRSSWVEQLKLRLEKANL